MEFPVTLNESRTVDELLETVAAILGVHASALLLSRLYFDDRGRLARVEKLPTIIYASAPAAKTLFRAHMEHGEHWAVDVLSEVSPPDMSVEESFVAHMDEQRRLRRSYIPIAQQLLNARPAIVELFVENYCNGEEQIESAVLSVEPTLTLTVRY